MTRRSDTEPSAPGYSGTVISGTGNSAEGRFPSEIPGNGMPGGGVSADMTGADTVRADMVSPDMVSADEFREAMGHFATGVPVITSVDAAGQPVGTTANGVTSLSLDP